MKRNKQAHNSVVRYYSEEKLDEFAGMSVRARLQWLEEMNTLINNVLGFQKRAILDERFKGM